MALSEFVLKVVEHSGRSLLHPLGIHLIGGTPRQFEGQVFHGAGDVVPPLLSDQKKIIAEGDHDGRFPLAAASASAINSNCRLSAIGREPKRSTSLTKSVASSKFR